MLASPQKKGFNLIELMVVIAIIAILASISLPMYTQFQNRSRASMAVKGAFSCTTMLQAAYSVHGSFTGMTLDDRDFTLAGRKLGLSIGSIQYAEYQIQSAAGDTMVIGWSFTQGCSDCAGRFCIRCDQDHCDIEVLMDEPKYNLDVRSDRNESVCT